MPKKLLKRWVPDHGKVRDHKSLRMFGDRLHDPNLWHFNRRSVAGGLALGVFVAFIPLPIQMLLAAALSLLLRVNLPLAVAAVWITNPLTMPPIFFICYKVGSWVLHSWPLNLFFELSPGHGFNVAKFGVLRGADAARFADSCIILALLTYGAVRLAWRLQVIAHIRQRKLRPRLKTRARSKPV